MHRSSFLRLIFQLVAIALGFCFTVRSQGQVLPLTRVGSAEWFEARDGSSHMQSEPIDSAQLGAQHGAIRGTVAEDGSGDPLSAANVTLLGTGIGTTTGHDGRFLLRNIPLGVYILRVTYFGYRTVLDSVQVEPDLSVARDFILHAVTLQGEQVLVTAQASGQSAAINQQLREASIVNIVSAARIQELPDVNAAESAGRLPGVSVVRSAGEGAEIVIRGLQPKYNAVSIDGIRIASSVPDNRSVDLSMISSAMLEGVQVSKSVTPDQDADLLGGGINFLLREPGASHEGIHLSLLTQGSYSGLANAQHPYNSYKYAASAEGRISGESPLSFFAQVEVDRRNLQSNELGAAYDHLGNSTTDYLTSSLNLNDIPRDRTRTNGAALVDYRLPEGRIRLLNFLSSGSTDFQNRGESYDIQTNVHSYALSHSSGTLNLITNALTVEHELPLVHGTLALSHTYSETRDPYDWSVGFQQASAGLGQFLNTANVQPQDIPRAAANNPDATYLGGITMNSSFSRERALAASLDLSAEANISDAITSRVQIGGKYRYQTRSFDYDQYGGAFGFSSCAYLDSLVASHFPATAPYANTTGIPLRPFMDEGYRYGKFLNGDYPMNYPLNFGMMSEMADFIMRNYDLIHQNNSVAFAHDNFSATTYDYGGNEKQIAFYIMSVLNLGPQITIIPGVRYQDLKTAYLAARGIETVALVGGGPYRHYDTTLTVDHGYWFPGIHLRYRPLDWFDVRLSYTNTVAYPDYNAIIPRNDVSTTGTIVWNNYGLTPSRSANYDAYLSFYNNSIGLFTAGAFLKQIKDLIYPWTFYVSGADALPYFPPFMGATAPTGTFSVSTYVNNPHRIDDWGFEFDWQTHFWYLPHPLDGLVLNINYTHIYSRAQYPYTIAERIGRSIIYVDSSFTDRLLFQPDDIVNVSLGYDYEGFSARVSMLHQGRVFTGVNFWPQLRTSTSAYTRWDLSVRQILPWFGLQVYGNVNNLNGVNDMSVINGRNAAVPQSQQLYGMTADLGLRWQL